MLLKHQLQYVAAYIIKCAYNNNKLDKLIYVLPAKFTLLKSKIDMQIFKLKLNYNEKQNISVISLLNKQYNMDEVDAISTVSTQEIMQKLINNKYDYSKDIESTLNNVLENGYNYYDYFISLINKHRINLIMNDTKVGVLYNSLFIYLILKPNSIDEFNVFLNQS